MAGKLSEAAVPLSAAAIRNSNCRTRDVTSSTSLDDLVMELPLWKPPLTLTLGELL